MSAEVEISRPALRPNTELMRGILPILVCSVLWGTIGLASVYAPAAASPESVGAGGMLVAGTLLLMVRPGARALVLHARGRDRVLLVIGALGQLTYPLAFLPAVRDLGVSLASAITLGSAPLFAGLIARFVERRRLTRRWLQCAPIAVAGTALLVVGDTSARSVSVTGVVLALIPGLAYAGVSTVAARLIGQGKASKDVYGALFGKCAILSIPVLAIYGVHGVDSVRWITVVLYLGCVTNGLCYTIFGSALRYTTAATATTVTLAEGAVGTLLGVFVHGERLAGAAWGGLGLLAAALVLLSLPKSARGAARRAARGRTAPSDGKRSDGAARGAAPRAARGRTAPSDEERSAGSVRLRAVERCRWIKRGRTAPLD